MADTSAGRRRLPRGFVPAAYLEHLPSIAGLCIAGIVYLQRTDTWPGPWVWALIVPLLTLRLVEPLYRVATVSMQISPRGLTLASGWSLRRTRTILWSDVSAADVREPWAYRLFGLARITLAQAGEETTQLVIPAVDAATRRELRAHLPNVLTTSRTGVDGDAPGKVNSPSPNQTSIYAASLIDLIVASFVHGQFAVGAAAAAGIAWEFLDRIGIDLTPDALAATPLTLAILTLLALMVAGVLVTVVRFANFEVWKSRTGGVVIRYGLFQRSERSVDHRAIAGVVLQANVGERALGRVRLGLLTTDSMSQLGTNLVLPSLPPPVVSRVLSEVLPNAPRHLSTGVAEGSVVRGLLTAAVSLLPGAVVIGAALSRDTARGLLLAAGVTLLVMCYGAGRVGTSRLLFNHDSALVQLTTRHVTDRCRLLETSAVHAVATLAIRRRRAAVRALYYAGGPRTAVVLRFRGDHVDALRAALTSNTPGGPGPGPYGPATTEVSTR